MKHQKIRSDMEPIRYEAQKITIDDLFKSEDAYIAVRNLCTTKHQLKDAMMYLFFMRSPRSTYKDLPDSDKLELLVRSGRIIDTAWLRNVITSDAMKELLGLYGQMVLTPSERLRVGMIDRINQFLSNLSNDVKDGKDIMARVKEGTGMYDAVEKLETMVIKDKKKIKAGYKTRLFENRGT